MKKQVILIGCLIMILSILPGCGAAKAKVEQKASEKILEQMAGGEVDVDLDGDQITLKGKDGEEFSMGSTKWPNSELAKLIPELKKGKVTTVMESKEGVFIVVDEIEIADYETYKELIKKDFAEDSYEMNGQDSNSYGASNTAGDTVLLQYGQNNLTITVAKAAE